MKENNGNEEFQSRREFFKKAAKMALPIMSIIAIPQILTSCDKDLWEEAEPTCRSCGGTCKNTCEKACSSNCELTCEDRCDHGCKNTCKSTCSATCRTYSKY